MDDELQSLETELQCLRPADPSRALLTRIGRDLAPPAIARPGFAWRWRWLGALPLAAACVVVWLQLSRPPVSPTANAVQKPLTEVAADESALLKPVAAENILVAARDEGFVTLADGTPARRERREFIETITWRNPRTRASLTWTVPREEVRVVPVVLQ